MIDEKPDLSGAATHFLRTEGPRGFLLRFALVYAALSLILQLFSLWTQAPVYGIYVRAFAENDGDISPYMDELTAASAGANLASMALLPVSLALWVLFEAASQRRYIRSDGFSLRLGADEGRLAIVGLIWCALLIAGYLALAIGAVIPGLIVGAIAGAAVGVVTGALVFVIGLVAALWLYARLSPASALTIRDNQIRFFEAWNVTKGCGWRLAGSYLLLFFGFMILTLVLYAVLIGAAVALVYPVIEGTPSGQVGDAVLAAVGQPSFWAPMTLLLIPVLMIQSTLGHALGGPAALVVRRRTAQGGMTVTDTFV